MHYYLIDHSLKKFTNAYLQSIYVLKNGNHPQTYGCAPNGELGISIILNGSASIYFNEKWIKQPTVSIYGLVKQVQFHRMSPHYFEINIGFNPHFLQAFLKDSMSCLLQRQGTDLFDLFKKDEVNRLYEGLNSSYSDNEIHQEIEDFLQRHLINESIDKRITNAHYLISKKNIMNVEQLSSMLNISSTGLRNLFKEKVGISPKDLMKIHRIRRILNSKDSDAESLTNLALKLEYFDQSHFIHDFKEAIGLSPKNYFNNKKLTFDYYNFGRWNDDSFDAI
jgi:AraC-like DNA-binding protein